MKDPWLNHMRKALDEHTETPPEDLWDDLEKTLFSKEENKTIIVPLVQKNENENLVTQKSNFDWRRIAAILLLLLSLGGGFLIWNSVEQNPKDIKISKNDNHGQLNAYLNDENSIIENNKDSLVSNSQNLIINENANENLIKNESNHQKISNENHNKEKLDLINISRLAKTIKSKNLDFNSIKKDKSNNIFQKPNNEFELINSDKVAKENTLRNQEKFDFKNDEINDKSIANTNIKQSADLENKSELLPEEHPEKAELLAKLEKEIEHLKQKKSFSDKFWSASLETSALAMGSNKSLDGYYSMNAKSVAIAPIVMGNSGYWQSPFVSVYEHNQGKAVETEIKHRNPISFGVAVQSQITDKIGISTGVQYTRLVSDLKAGTVNTYVKSEQIIQYLGVPLNINYKFFEKEKWNIYVNAGGQIDLPMDGVMKTKYVDVSNTTTDPSQKLSDLKTQFSTSAGLGIQYNLTPRLGIYAEPTMLYYLDNGSAVGSIYKEKPVNFNLKVGLKLNLTK